MGVPAERLLGMALHCVDVGTGSQVPGVCCLCLHRNLNGGNATIALHVQVACQQNSATYCAAYMQALQALLRYTSHYTTCNSSITCLACPAPRTSPASFARIGSFARVVGPLKHLAADTAQAKVMSQLHERFGAALGSLVSELSAHYNALLTRTPAGSAQMESSREELESLLNLIERISLGRGSAAASRQGGLAGAVLLGGY